LHSQEGFEARLSWIGSAAHQSSQLGYCSCNERNSLSLRQNWKSESEAEMGSARRWECHRQKNEH